MATHHVTTAAQAAQRHIEEALSLVRLVVAGIHPNDPRYRNLDLLEGFLRSALTLLPVEPIENNIVPLRVVGKAVRHHG